MSDLRLEQLRRRGIVDNDWEPYYNTLMSMGLLTIYNEAIGPKSILETECAYDNCSNLLKWSNCSYCEGHHGHHGRYPPHKSSCHENDILDTYPGVPTGAVSGGEIISIMTYSCHKKDDHETNVLEL